jgi:hypothetical protein
MYERGYSSLGMREVAQNGYLKDQKGDWWIALR